MSEKKHKSPSTKKRDRMRMMNYNLKKEEEAFKTFEIDKDSNIDSTEDIYNMIIDNMDEAKVCFFSSTPKKVSECQVCVENSNCVDCRIKHMLGRHVVARALFDGWPPDRLHLLL